MSAEKCAVHPHVILTRFCPICRASHGGKKTSAAKTSSVRENGKKGGRPRKPERSS